MYNHFSRLVFIICTALLTLSIFSMWGSTLISLGYGLYLWGGVGLALGVAAWSAFKLFLILLFGGFITFILASIGMKVTE